MAQSQETVEVPGVNPDLEKVPPTVMEISDPPRASSEEAVYRDPLTRPVYFLSVKLIDTYKSINKVYYDAKAKKLKEQAESTAGRTGVKNNGYDNADYDYIVHNDTGEIFNERYIIKHKLGKGSFGQVFCAYDQINGNEVAIKIIKSRKPFTQQAQIEIELLKHLRDSDSNDEMNIVHLLDTFMHHEHQCLVFEMMSYNLYDLLKNTRFKGVSLNLIRKFAKQILRALEYLSRSDINVIHCDLKPENILLKHPRRSAIKLIDFGSSCYFNKKTYSYIQSRFYRSPEILLGTMNYSQKIDMWSLGCVLVEMHTGEPLFGGTDALDQITRIVQIMGPMPFDMVESIGKPENKAKYFTRVDTKETADQMDTSVSPVADITSAANSATVTSGSAEQTSEGSPARASVLVATDGEVSYFLKPPSTTSESKSSSSSSKRNRTLTEVIGVHTDGPYGRRRGEAGHTVEDYMMFFDMVKKMLIYNPEERISPTDALKEPFMLQGGSTGSEAAAASSSTGAATADSGVAMSALPQPPPSSNVTSGAAVPPEPPSNASDMSTKSIPFQGMSLQSNKEEILDSPKRGVRPSSAPSSLTPHGSKRRMNSSYANGEPNMGSETNGSRMHGTDLPQSISGVISDEVKSPEHKVPKNTPPASPSTKL